MSIQIIYWTGSGNTGVMAEALAAGFIGLGNEVSIKQVHEATLQDIEKAQYVLLGCPSMGAEVLEETEMEPFVESLSTLNWAGKKLALFGSYDWGDGQWMRDWEARMTEYGATLATESFITQNTPDDAIIEQLKAYAIQMISA